MNSASGQLRTSVKPCSLDPFRVRLSGSYLKRLYVYVYETQNIVLYAICAVDFEEKVAQYRTRKKKPHVM
jgi:hypothetical protein